MGLFGLVMYTPPTLTSILVAAILLWLATLTLLSFFVSSKLALIVAFGVSFVMFLKAVDLLTIINVVLLVAFLVLLIFYFRKPKEDIKDGGPTEPRAELRRDILFPKGWPFRVGRRRKG